MLKNIFKLPELAYGYNELAPYISEEQLKLHHDKHHLAYVKGANAVLEKLDKARQDQAEVDMKALLKELSFHVCGHVLHSKFWKNLAPKGKGGEPAGELLEKINEGFGSMERFKKEFTQAAVSVEGSGWAGLVYNSELKQLMISQIEKHNINALLETNLLMVLDAWEHAYYLDYKNERPKFVEAFWNIVDWNEVGKNLKKVLQ